jgi:3-oxoacyl-[acyl-carrier-protein] synthase II
MSRVELASAKNCIAVTGMGVVCAAGDSPATLWESAARGLSPAVQFADPKEPDSPSIPACVVPRIDPKALTLHRSHKMDRSVQLALQAAGQAIADARLPNSPGVKARLGVVAGTSRGPAHVWAELSALAQRNPRKLPPTLAAYGTLAGLSGALAQALEAHGPCLTVSGTCASAAHAIVLAAQQIRLGTADVMLAGGSEAPLQAVVIAQLLSSGILGANADPRQACRPFDINRNGTLLGEGAAFLVLESLPRAHARGASIHGLLVGYASGSEPYHCTAPREDGAGLLQVMTEALAMARLQPGQIDYFNAHGTGTRLNDRIEVVAMRRLLESRMNQVPCSSTKPITGHCLGASPALEAVICLYALKQQCVPPTANCTELDPNCPIDAVLGSVRPTPLQVVMSNSLGFWGNNASLILAQESAAWV